MSRKHNTQHRRSRSNYGIKKAKWGYDPKTNPRMTDWDSESIERARSRERKNGYDHALAAYRARGGAR
jgi:hypothetical protein